jgi:glucokinase
MGKDENLHGWRQTMILGGDVGGTKTNLAAFERSGKRLHKIYQRKFPSREAASFEEMLRVFLEGLEAGTKCEAACFGVAGPVIGRRVHPTNLSWAVDAVAAGKILGTDRVQLVNDMEASFAGVDALEEKDLVTLQAGRAEPRATQALVAAGTGLGESFRVWDGSRYRVVPSEGGHSDFAPRTEREIELLRFLKKSREWVDVESVVSGRGFHAIHTFLDAGVDHPAFHDPSIDTAADITGRALEGTCAVCVEAVDMWVSLYGAEAGNLALKTLARGGVFVAGGIAGKILPKLKTGRFVEAFAQKAELGDVLRAMPITVVLDPEAPVVGAAATAAALL